MPDPGIGAGAAAALEPIEELCRRVDLVVVPAFGERGQLVQILGEPRRRFRQTHKTVLDHRGLRVHAHDLVRLRLIAGEGVQTLLHQFLDQLGARGLVLDQYADPGRRQIAGTPSWISETSPNPWPDRRSIDSIPPVAYRLGGTLKRRLIGIFRPTTWVCPMTANLTKVTAVRRRLLQTDGSCAVHCVYRDERRRYGLSGARYPPIARETRRLRYYY